MPCAWVRWPCCVRRSDGRSPRAVYSVSLPNPGADFMWYLAASVGNDTVVFPPTAPLGPQQVVVLA